MSLRNIKQAIRDRYAWPGGYALYIVTIDGGTLCTTCARAEFHQIVYAALHRLKDQWRAVAVGSTEADDEPPVCDHCGKLIQ